MKKLALLLVLLVLIISITSCEANNVNDETGIELTEQNGIDKDQNVDDLESRDDE